MARRALVTGATGGLGLALVEALIEAGYQVRATGRDAAAGARLRTRGAEFEPAEITSATAIEPLVRDVDAVFHAAALSSPWGPPADFWAINVEATQQLLAAARQARAESFVFVSTPSVYTEPRDRMGLTEASPLARRFASIYALTKYRAEQAVLAANAPGFATVAIRPRALVGPDDKVLLPRLVRVARQGRLPLFREGQALIDLTDVRDAAAALVLADQRSAALAGTVLNVSGGQPTSVAQILDQVLAALDLHPRLVKAPYSLAAALAGAMEGICTLLPGRPEPPVTRYSLMTLAFSQTFDLTAAFDRLGWRPRFSPAEAIERTAQAWSAHATG